ncbi:MAG TPA: long-chain fatty acid--CoA ligase [Candidatus Eremiobacteraceae bacterium]|nr:long-chain fatty acid--CoA ligase [Candidatus Eremiobacteraceae bacterium]
MTNPETLNGIFSAIVERALPQTMMTRVAGQWVPIGAQQLHQSVMSTARALRDWGIEKGDRVAILSENRPAWAIADFASLQLGAVVVPIYSTLSAQQVAYILSDSGAKVVFASTEEQLTKVLQIKNQSVLERIVVMEQVESSEAVSMVSLGTSDGRATGDDAEIAARAQSVTPDDLASIIYTSGTTGVPKGVELTHGNLTSNMAYSLAGFDVGPGQISLSFLPLSHVTARHADLALLYRGVTLAYCPFIEDLPQALQEVRPHIVVAVPRVYEKLYSQVEQAARGLPKRAICRWALSVGRAHAGEILAGNQPKSLGWKLANKLLYSRIRERLGGRAEIFVSGGAPLGKELAEWFANIGIRIHEGYGLTETSPVIALNSPVAHKLGTVGRPLANVEVRIASDSEILVRGPSVFRGYWNKPDETREAFVDGWFKTGDIGMLDQDGYLVVTDRKKDLLKTSGGKFVAPQPIENSLKLNAYVGAAVVLGDRRRYPSVIISPHFSRLEEWARANHIPSSSREILIENPRVKALYDDIVGQVNRGLGRHEMLKKVLLVPHEFTPNDGTLTPTLKIRRRIIEERYARQIAELYEERVWRNGTGEKARAAVAGHHRRS